MLIRRTNVSASAPRTANVMLYSLYTSQIRLKRLGEGQCSLLDGRLNRLCIPKALRSLSTKTIVNHLGELCDEGVTKKINKLN